MAEIASSKTTPLYAEHVRRGGKMVPFGGWLMPVQYSSIIEEHHAVRKAVGVFDISHMGQITATGSGASAWLNATLTNNIERLEVGCGQYTFLLNENAGIIDDLIVYRTKPDEFLLVVNASRVDEDFAWMEAHLWEGVELKNRSAEFAGLAIQGPRVAQIFDLFFGADSPRPARNEIVEMDCRYMRVTVARTGYTGEDGFEIFFPAKNAERVWNDVLERGESLGIRPCGLGARDTLRLEMCFPLNGSDLSPEHNPLEAGLSFFVDLTKPNFIGRDALLRVREQGLGRRLVPFRMSAKGPPPRPHYSVLSGEKKIGEVTSGTLSPSLNCGIGMAYVPPDKARIGEEFDIEIRGQRFGAVVEKKPLYRKL